MSEPLVMHGIGISLVVPFEQLLAAVIGLAPEDCVLWHVKILIQGDGVSTGGACEVPGIGGRASYLTQSPLLAS
jgi:hypothetical protein